MMLFLDKYAAKYMYKKAIVAIAGNNAYNATSISVEMYFITNAPLPIKPKQNVINSTMLRPKIRKHRMVNDSFVGREQIPKNVNIC